MKPNVLKEAWQNQSLIRGGINKAAQLIEERHVNPRASNLLHNQPSYQKVLIGKVFRKIQKKTGFHLFLLTLRTRSEVTLGVLSPRMLQNLIAVIQGQILNIGDLLKVFAVA